jgi:hypothetical protein
LSRLDGAFQEAVPLEPEDLMQVLIAYALDNPEDDASAPLERVADHYSRLWEEPVTRQGRDTGRIGMHVWDSTEPHCRWPVWQEDPTLAVATLDHPLGYARVVGVMAADGAAIPLGRALLDRPSRVVELLAPFVLCALEFERARLTMITDALGMGQLYELRFHGGWAWSNRPAALLRFAGERAAADALGWRMFAATGWFMGERTPFERIYRVPAGTQIEYDAAGPGRVERRTETLAELAVNRRSDALTTHGIDEAAHALQALACSLTRVLPGDIAIRLSGGRDSRVVAAAFLSAGVNVRLETDGAEAGEATIAQMLIAALPMLVDHRIDPPERQASNDGPGAAMENLPTLERALGWHRCRDGLRPSTFLAEMPPSGFRTADRVTVGGGGGEIARSSLYPPNFRDLDELPYGERIAGYLEASVTKVVRRQGLSAQARDAAAAQVRRVVLEAVAAGLDDARILNYFHAAERTRRWGSMRESNGLVSPLLIPEFLRAGFDQTPEQHRADALHQAVIDRLMPAWTDVPYYARPEGEIPPTLRPRLGAAPDRHLISAVLDDAEQWEDSFDAAVVRREWESLQSGNGSPAAERLLQRVIWRAVFTDYLAELNGEEPPVRSAMFESLERSIRQGPLLRGRRFTGRALRKVARVVEPV